MDFFNILEQCERDAMHWGIAPTLVEEPAGSVEMIEVCFILGTAPEIHVGNLEIAPEMTGGVTVGLGVVLGAVAGVGQPLHGVVLMDEVGMVGEELLRLGPESGKALGGVVEVDGVPVGLIVILHPPEDVVVDVAEEVDLGLDAPVIANVFKGRVLVEHATVPTAHLVVGWHVPVLYIILLEHLRGLIV